MCYAARYVNVDFNKRPSDAEKDSDNAEDKSEDSDDSNKSGSGDLSGSADGDADSANARRGFGRDLTTINPKGRVK